MGKVLCWQHRLILEEYFGGVSVLLRTLRFLGIEEEEESISRLGLGAYPVKEKKAKLVVSSVRKSDFKTQA